MIFFNWKQFKIYYFLNRILSNSISQQMTRFIIYVLNCDNTFYTIKYTFFKNKKRFAINIYVRKSVIMIFNGFDFLHIVLHDNMILLKKKFITCPHMSIVLLKVCSNMHYHIYGGPFTTDIFIMYLNVFLNLLCKLKIGMQKQH